MEWLMEILDDRAQRLRRESRRLMEDDRADEGNLTKIRANVYGICKSVFQVLDRERAGAKLCELHDTWQAALEKARGHDDLERAAIESVKLETLDEIQCLLNTKCEV